jgi:hypothetical protein
MSVALFEPAGDGRWAPTELARGPWDDRHCHGGPVGALLTRAVEGIDDDPEWHLARLSIELLRPVPVGLPLSIATEIERPGRKVSLVAARLTLDDPAGAGPGGTEVARVRALRIRRRVDPLPEGTVHVDDPPPGHPETSPWTPAEWRSEWRFPAGGAFHSDGCEHRYISGGVSVPGPVEVWIRLTVGVVPDEEPSAAQRVAAAADFGNGVSAGIAADGYSYINPDLTIHLARPLLGVWVGMRSATDYGDGSSGVGYAESALYDVDGRIGRSVQSLLIGRAG